MSRRNKLIVALCVLAVAVGVLAAVVVTLGSGVTVPDVTGKTEAEATQALEAAGLSVGQVEEASDPDAELGTVVRQDPAAGDDADEGAAVGLTLSSGPATAKVPDVTGMTEAEAEGTLRDAGFASASESQYDLTAPAGEVLAQLPEAGQDAVAGSPVGLLVSKGRPEVTMAVPDVTGMTADEATATLADSALTAVLVEAYAADVPAGDVADQEPAPGALVAPLSEVLVTVSLGEGTTSVTVPDVVGLREADASDEMKATGLVVTTARAYSDEVGAGRVIAQAPEAGAKVDDGAAAGLLVSLGRLPSPSPTPSPSPSVTVEPAPSASATEPASVEPDPPSDPAVPTAIVPDLVGTDAAAAEAELEELGLRPVPLDAPSATAPAGTVYAQLPAAGTEVPKTYPVLLLVSTGAGLQASPSPAGE
jgi:eukaryotic-like serine/threonine-protein kinase